MALKHGDKVQRCYRYHKIVFVKPTWKNDFRTYYYEDKVSIAYHGPVFRYRYDPVPGVKHWKNTVQPYNRHMGTTYERRWYYAHKDEVHIRSKRNPRNLPHSWDDFRHARREKGWKRTKKRKQWMKGKGGTKRVTSCHDYGISHGCDAECPALLGGDCAVPEEVLAEYEEEFTPEEFEELKELYNLTNKRYESIW